jgi:hypothetical protein
MFIILFIQDVESVTVGDRGHVVVNVPAPVVPYVPAFSEPLPDPARKVPNRARVKKTRQRTTTSATAGKPSRKNAGNLGTMSEDFDAFRDRFYKTFWVVRN